MYFYIKYIVTLFYKKLRIKIVVCLLRESGPWFVDVAYVCCADINKSFWITNTNRIIANQNIRDTNYTVKTIRIFMEEAVKFAWKRCETELQRTFTVSSSQMSERQISSVSDWLAVLCVTDMSQTNLTYLFTELSYIFLKNTDRFCHVHWNKLLFIMFQQKWANVTGFNFHYSYRSSNVS